MPKPHRTLVMAAAALALAGAAACTGVGTASAATAGPYWVQLLGPDHVGVYAQPGLGFKADVPDLNPGDYVDISCWISGSNVGTAGDVWYYTTKVYYPTQGGATDTVVNVWTFAPYVDHADSFRDGLVPNCES
jgi:hypothetical protein